MLRRLREATHRNVHAAQRHPLRPLGEREVDAARQWGCASAEGDARWQRVESGLGHLPDLAPVEVERVHHGRAGDSALLAVIDQVHSLHRLLRNGALTLAEAVGDDPTRALALQFLGTLTRGRGDLADAWNLGERAHDLHRKLGNRIGEGTSALILATVAEDRGDYEQACCLCARALAVFRELGHVWGTARSLSTLARSMRNGGDAAGALPLFEEAVPAQRALGDRQGLVWSLLGLGGTAVDLRDAPRAYVALSEAVAVVREVGDRWSIARALDGCAGRCGRVHR